MTKKSLIQEIGNLLHHSKHGTWSGREHRVGNMHWIYNTCVVIVDKPLKGGVAQYRTIRYYSHECSKARLRKIINILKERI